MLISGLDLINTPILSLQTGSELARTESAIINPHDLSVIAYELDGPRLDHKPSLLRTQEIRELSTIGFIVDSSDDFVIPEDIIKLNDIYQLKFTLINKHVLDEKRNKLGKIIDYNLDNDGFVIQQLTVKRPLFQSFNDPELIIHRSQVVEVTDSAVVIKSKGSIKHMRATAKQSYANPFRQPAPQPETAHTERR